jgi:hypothetical protein
MLRECDAPRGALCVSDGRERFAQRTRRFLARTHKCTVGAWHGTPPEDAWEHSCMSAGTPHGIARTRILAPVTREVLYWYYVFPRGL